MKRNQYLSKQLLRKNSISKDGGVDLAGLLRLDRVIKVFYVELT